jgi:hypothetical protein
MVFMFFSMDAVSPGMVYFAICTDIPMKTNRYRELLVFLKPNEERARVSKISIPILSCTFHQRTFVTPVGAYYAPYVLRRLPLECLHGKQIPRICGG